MSPKYTKWVVDGDFMDTRSNIISSVRLSLLPAVKIAKIRNMKLDMKDNKSFLNGIGEPVDTLRTIDNSFHFVGLKYSVTLKINSGNTPLIISHKALDDMGVYNQSYHKIIETVDDGYSELVKMKNYLSFLVCSKYRFLTRAQLWNIHRNLGYPSVEKQMKIIEQAGLEDIPEDTGREEQRLVKYCEAVHLIKAD